jgi:hypothetical protein
MNLDFAYNSSLFSYNSSGFLCDFGTSGGSCPSTTSQLTGVQSVPIAPLLTLESPLAGSVVNITNTPGVFDLSYNLTGAANPPPLGPDQNAFAIVLNANVPLSDLVTYQTAAGNFSFNAVSSTCTGTGNTSGTCGDSPVDGVSFQAISGPTAGAGLPGLALLGGGIAWGLKRRKRVAFVSSSAAA